MKEKPKVVELKVVHRKTQDDLERERQDKLFGEQDSHTWKGWLT